MVFQEQELWKKIVEKLFLDQKQQLDLTIEGWQSLYKKADESICDITVQLQERSATPIARKRQEETWYLTRTKDLLPGNFSGKEGEWAWKEDLEYHHTETDAIYTTYQPA